MQRRRRRRSAGLKARTRRLPDPTAEPCRCSLAPPPARTLRSPRDPQSRIVPARRRRAGSRQRTSNRSEPALAGRVLTSPGCREFRLGSAAAPRPSPMGPRSVSDGRRCRPGSRRGPNRCAHTRPAVSRPRGRCAPGEGRAADHPDPPRLVASPHLQHERAIEQPQSRERRTGSAQQAGPGMLPGLRDPRLDHRHVRPEEFGPLRMPRILPGQQVPPCSVQVGLCLPAKGMWRRLAHRRPGARAPLREIVRVLSQPPPGAPRTATRPSRRHPRLSDTRHRPE